MATEWVPDSNVEGGGNWIDTGQRDFSDMLAKYGYSMFTQGPGKSVVAPIQWNQQGRGAAPDQAGLMADPLWNQMKGATRIANQQDLADLADPNGPGNGEGGSDFANIMKALAFVGGGAALTGALGAGAAGASAGTGAGAAGTGSTFGELEALSAANPGRFGMAAADAAAGAGAAGTGGTFGGLEALSAANPGTYGMAAADAAAGAAGAAAGAAGAGAAGTGMFQQLMAATGLSEKQLMGLGSAGISSLASLYGASQIGKAARTAADIGAGATDRATALQQSQYDQTRADLAPYRAAGTNALAQLTAGTAPGGQFTKSFGMSDFEQDPGYGFRMSEGLKALDRSAAARGGLLSGATLKGAQRYGQDLGSQEYQNAFNRYQTNRSNLLNPLQSLAGIGQTSTNQGISAGQNYATNVGNLGMNAAGTQANAGLTAAQANQSAYGNVGNAFANYLTPNPMNEFFLNQLNKRPGP